MDSVKKICRISSGFVARSKTVLLCTLAGSLLLNLVLFLQIPLHTKPDLSIHSHETVQLFEAVPVRGRELHIVPMQSPITNATFMKRKRHKHSKSVRTKHQIHTTTHRFSTQPPTTQKTRQIRTPRPRQTTQHVFPTQPPTTTMRTPPTPQNPKSACPRMTIHADKDIPLQDTVCRPHLPAEDACKYTAEIFKLDPSIGKCHDQKEPPYKLCRISEIRDGKRLSAPKVECDISACLKTEDITLNIVDPSDGNYLQLDLPGTTTNKEMTSVVIQAIDKTRTNGFNFMFIDCTGKKRQEKISQLLTFLPTEKVFQPKGEGFPDKVNVNVVLLDSISRPQFYRSLRKTVSHLRGKNADPSYSAHIFDFELFQSVHGHTHENEHALFGGTLYPENFTKAEKEDAPTNMEVLFGVFKDAGYQTMSQNDMCWKAWYGFILSFMTEDWSELQEKMKGVIDSTGITEASCKILKRYQRTTSFTDGEDHQICYNGKHQHRHMFDHLTKYLHAVTTTSQSKPLFSFTETNVAHDDVGIRVQTLDDDLIHFIDNVAQLPNTFTLLYADHGNTYTEYQVSMLEGRLEMYHPTLLGILPKELGRKFGKDVVENLRTNQYRLLHLFDIRESLVELANYDTRSRLNPVGIFREIPKDRTCDDLQLSTPNFCICEGWDIPVENSTAQVALAEFAIGQLNNQLQSSFLASRGDELINEPPILLGACQRLQLQSITNVRQRQTAKGTVVTTIDAKVQSGNIVDQEELITVQVESAQQPDSDSFDMRLVTFNRISHYAIYEQCVDPGVPVHLCICNKRDTKTPAKRQNSTIYDIVGKNAKVRELKPCLLLIKRAYSENNGKEDFVGVEVYEFANICTDKEFSVKLDAETDNVRSSTELPIMVELKPRSIYFASVMMTEVGYLDAKLKLKLRIVTDDLQGDDEENAGKRSGKAEGKEDLGENDENGGKRSGKPEVKDDLGENDKNGGKRGGRQEGNKKDNLDKKWRKTSSRTKKRGRKGEKWKQTIDVNK